MGRWAWPSALSRTYLLADFRPSPASLGFRSLTWSGNAPLQGCCKKSNERNLRPLLERSVGSKLSTSMLVSASAFAALCLTWRGEASSQDNLWIVGQSQGREMTQCEGPNQVCVGASCLSGWFLSLDLTVSTCQMGEASPWL